MLPAIGLAAAAGQAAIVETPTGAPSNGSVYKHSGTKLGVSWTNGDASASTRVYHDDGTCPSTPLPGDLTLLQTVAPGVTSYNSNKVVGQECRFWLAHYKGGVLSEFHQVVQGEADECLACAE